MTHESLNDALVDCVKAAGGSKVVGPALWPEKPVEAAQRHLLNCLNDTRQERLTPEQVLLVARLAREKGCHAYAEFVAAELHYAAPQPVEPTDELADLIRRYLQRDDELAPDRARSQRMLSAHLSPKAAA